jgi:hypothetical protein
MAFLSRHNLVFFMAATVLGLSACDPCRSLADKICECERTPAARETCRRSLDLFGNMKGFDIATKTDTCRALLSDPKCNCQAIDNGEFEKCGMTR